MLGSKLLMICKFLDFGRVSLCNRSSEKNCMPFRGSFDIGSVPSPTFRIVRNNQWIVSGLPSGIIQLIRDLSAYEAYKTSFGVTVVCDSIADMWRPAI